MAVRDLTLLSAADFDNFIADHVGDEIYEFVDGKVVQVPSNPWVSNIAGMIFSLIWLHLRTTGLPVNTLTGADGGFMVNGQRFAPDVAYVGPDKRFVDRGYNPDPPDLAVEVVSDEDNRTELKDLAAKLPHYRAAGVTVWVILPRAQRAEIHDPAADPAQPPGQLGPDDDLQVPDLLPGFSLPLREIFSETD
ncbi:MAG: Uma2 family endonuclease [Anaerolineaceae bacterium]|nr:Uma2 family endonuclease [Anaerolineaceae bacterium]